jgi:hypothetical protein
MKQKIMPAQNWIRVADGIYRRSSGTLYERPIINHRPTWRSLGTKNLKLAREELHKRRIKGEASYVPKPTVVTTGQVIRCYEQDGYSDRHREKRTGRTMTKEKKNCETLLKFWQHIPVDAVTLAACDRYHEWRKKNIMKGYAGNRTVDMELTTLSNAFLWSCRKELVRSNPMSVYRPRYCSDKNIRHCREFMPNDSDELHRIAELMFASLRSYTLGWQLLIEAATGLRTVEALKLRTDAQPYQPGWITPDGKSLCVWRAKNQQAVNPFVLIHEGLAAVLKAHKRWKDERFPDSPWYFPSYKKPDIIQTFGPFDLAPCAPVKRPWATATNYFTMDDDGLSKKWQGLVWCNPPCGQKTGDWLARCAEHNVTRWFLPAPTHRRFKNQFGRSPNRYSSSPVVFLSVM